MPQVVEDFTADYKTIYMLYRLLRNNKESGPFTALQLKEMGLKPYDLLWAEGRGAAWQYASELPELKDFAPVVEEQPFERFSKRKEAVETVAQPAVAAKKVKPRYRISNGQLIMVEAGNMEVGTNGVIKETAPVHHISTVPAEAKTPEVSDWQTIYPQWQPQQPEKEKKTQVPVEIETKYTESLDDLKKRYAEKVLGDKKETSSSSISSASVKQNIMAVVALVVLVAGGYIGYTLKKKDASVVNGQPAIERADIAGDNSAGQTEATDGNTDVSHSSTSNNAQSNTQPVSEEGKSVKQVVVTTTNTNNKTVTPVINTNSKTAVQTPQKKNEESVVKAGVPKADKVTDKPVAQSTKEAVNANGSMASSAPVSTSKNNSNTSVLLAAAPVTKPAAKQIGDYVSVKKIGGSGASVQNVKLMVSNVSDFPIDLAVVDIQYFDSKGKFQKGETMYVKDINGGNNVEVRVPDSDKSSSIKYKVSMVQADQKTLYLVAD